LAEVQVLADREKKISRLTKSSKILKVIIKAIQDKKGENVVSLDMRKIPEAVADFFIICDANANVQVKAIADSVEDLVKQECGELPYRHEGYQALQWVLVDYVNVTALKRCGAMVLCWNMMMRLRKNARGKENNLADL
jgi:ribosome-associated protein